MEPQNSIPYSLKSGNIQKDIKAIKNWVNADLKYQIWSLNISNSQINTAKEQETKKEKEGNIFTPKK